MCPAASAGPYGGLDPELGQHLARLALEVARRLGLYYPPARRGDLWRGIRQAAPELGYEDCLECLYFLLSTPWTQRMVEIVARHLTIGETYFYRDSPVIRDLREHLLPWLIRRKSESRELRIWSAGCCTGEEPYTLAILLENVLLDMRGWRITILATDVNDEYLAQAREGIYREWSFRGVPVEIRRLYFRELGNGRYQIRERFRRMVRFAALNLVEELYPSPLTHTFELDLILCRNVLMYFSSRQALRVLDRLHDCLAEGGWLVTTAGESTLLAESPFRAQRLGSTLFFRKARGVSLGQAEAPERRWSAPPAASPAFPMARAPHSAAAVGLPEPAESPLLEPVSMGLNARNTPQVDSLEATAVKARDLYRQGRYQELVRLLESTLERLAAHDGEMARGIELIRLLVRTYANLRRPECAESWCRRGIAADKMNPALHHALAVILMEQERLPEARKALNDAIYLDPNYTVAHFALAVTYQRQGDSVRARRHFRNALDTLQNQPPDEPVPGADGMSADDLRALIGSLISEEVPA